MYTKTGMESADESRGSIKYGFIRSPCLSCKHKIINKNECLSYEDCVLYQPKEPIYSRRPDKGRKKFVLKCTFPECGDTYYSDGNGEGMCHRCRMLVHKRKKSGWPDNILYKPPGSRRKRLEENNEEENNEP